MTFAKSINQFRRKARRELHRGPSVLGENVLQYLQEKNHADDKSIHENWQVDTTGTQPNIQRIINRNPQMADVEYGSADQSPTALIRRTVDQLRLRFATRKPGGSKR